MPESNQLYIAYCEKNKDFAAQIQNSLLKANFQFVLSSDQSLTSGESISEYLSRQSGPGLLLISDNFLKSEACMKDMLAFIENPSLSKAVQYVITDGIKLSEDGITREFVPTNFDRVSSVIKYMNYWQEKYLEMRKIKRTLAAEEEESFNKKLSLVKSISAQIGDFLRLLRTKDCWTFESMTANDFALFFNKYGNPVLHSNFKKTNAPQEEPEDSFELEHDLSSLPGIDLLTKAQGKGIPPVVEEKIDRVENVPEPVMAEDEFSNSGANLNPDLSYSNHIDSLEEEDFEEEELLEPEIQDSYNELQAVYEDEDEPDDEDEIIEDITEDFVLQNDEDIAENIDNKIVDDGNPPADNFTDEDDNTQRDDPEHNFHEASKLIESGEIEQAIHRLKDITQNYPNNTNARLLLAGVLLAYKKDTAQAKNQLLKVVKYDPLNHEAYHYLAELAESSHDYILAKKYYERVVDLAPETKDVYYKLGLITSGFFKEKTKLAAKYFKKAVSENKKNTDAWYRLGVLYNEEFDKPGKALKHFKKVLKLQEDHPFANYDLALLYHSIGDPHNAASYYYKACLANPEIQTEENDQVFRLDKFAKPGGSSNQDIKGSKNKKGKVLKVPKFVKKLSESSSYERLHTIVERQPDDQTGKIVFITGATSGIGKATAQIFAENGYRLILNGRREDRLKEVKRSFEDQFNTKHLILPFDVRDIDSVKEAVKNLDEEWRQIDILINNAGLAKGYAPIYQGDLDHWETMIDTNLKGLLYLTRAVSPHMVKRRSGHIINICSSAGHEVYPNGNVYCATKFAVDALTKSMRIDLHKFNIRVGQVSPGHVEETEFAFVRFEDKKKAKIYEDFQPLKSSDVAAAIFYMASAPPHVNIQDIQLMGTQQASNVFIDRSGR